MRPHIVCHMGTSLDGGLHPSRFTRPAAGVSVDALRRHYEAIHDRSEAEGWIVGRKTMAEMAKGRERPVVVSSPLAREPHLGHRNGRNLAVAIDPSGRVHYGQDNVGGDHVVAVLGEQVSDAYLAELREDGASIFLPVRGARTFPVRWSSLPLFSASRNFSLRAAAGSTARFSSIA